MASVATLPLALAAPVAADFEEPPPGGEIIIVNIATDGTAFDDSGTEVRPCPDGYEFNYSTIAPSPEGPLTDGARLTRMLGDIEQVYFYTFCLRQNAETLGYDYADERNFWVGVPNMGTVIPAAFDQVAALVDPPIVSWPTMDREFGWLYVNADMEFRVAALAPVTATATLENILGTATATATATPVSVTFFPGEPDGRPVTCSIEDASAGFSPDIVGACSYRYSSSSAVAPDGREFTTRMVVNWEVTGDIAPDAPNTLETYTDSSIAVAEIQAVVCADQGC